MIVDLDEGRKWIFFFIKVLENYLGEMLEKIDEVMELVDVCVERVRKVLF